MKIYLTLPQILIIIIIERVFLKIQKMDIKFTPLALALKQKKWKNLKNMEIKII